MIVNMFEGIVTIPNTSNTAPDQSEYLQVHS